MSGQSCNHFSIGVLLAVIKVCIVIYVTSTELYVPPIHDDVEKAK